MIPENAIRLDNDVYSVFVEKFGKRYFLCSVSSREEAEDKYLEYVNTQEEDE